VVSQADGEGLVYSLCELSARCIAEALLFVGVSSQPVLPFRASAPPEGKAPYFALAPMRLQ
jgi:hypothetical protein